MEQTDWRTIKYVSDVDTKNGLRVGLLAATESSKECPNPEQVLCCGIVLQLLDAITTTILCELAGAQHAAPSRGNALHPRSVGSCSRFQSRVPVDCADAAGAGAAVVLHVVKAIRAFASPVVLPSLARAQITQFTRVLAPACTQTRQTEQG